ncbi:MAG: NADH:ubiquinone reductase (Na(+)-transporting) subunit B [Halobacteriovoraceae bacterium]|nr:NADH:ubiquinone reductase (Na(+)-transporting) subunit B [Halobacteriovoraceae bacterium]MCB9094074.1 NADH:ubiquinone reductase (Na(+)-transporting) subunit B [Halobacteriovoraceae bacterium]
MKFIENLLEKQKSHFEKGGKLEKLYPLYEAIDTFIFTPPDVTSPECTHVRESLDLKRTMMTVAWALIPCTLMAMYNTGYQANLALEHTGLVATGWRADVMNFLGIGFSAASCLSNFAYGALFFIPVFLVTNIVGGLWELLFSVVRKHEINEGFLVTGMLFPLILPPTIPLWQVAAGISFGVVIGKEVFGGTGKNILNPALTSRVFLFFAYPAQISGDAVWTAVDGFTGATALGQAATGGLSAVSVNWWDAFWGFIPGSMGETSTAACLFGAFFLIITGIGSWRIMLSSLIGMISMSLLLNNVGSDTNMMFAIPPQWHFVLGSFAFATVFMATDPVSAAMTDKGRWLYGFLIGVLGIIIRCVNPAYPEGWMLAILFMNAFAPLIDYFVVKSNITRRMKRNV